MTRTTTQPRTAIVTGAARGIGAGVARRLAADGFAVAVVDLDEAACKPVVEDIHAADGRALAVGIDVADEAQVRAGVERITVELGAPTVLINNAGTIRDNLLFRMSVDDWDDVMGVHLRGSFLMSREVQGHMRTAGWGRIVNLSSTSALGNRGQANYAAAKARISCTGSPVSSSGWACRRPRSRWAGPWGVRPAPTTARCGCAARTTARSAHCGVGRTPWTAPPGPLPGRRGP